MRKLDVEDTESSKHRESKGITMVFDSSKREKRIKAIQNLLMMRQHLTIPELCEELGASESTVRNDLRDMEEMGMAKRVYGGAIATGTTAFNVGVSARSPAFRDEKQAIGHYVLEKYVQPGMTFFLDTGTTAVELAKLVAELPFRVTVLTNSLDVAHIISASEHHALHLAGGYYDPMIGSFHDHSAFQYLNSVHADIFFLCPAGVTIDAGFTGPDHGETELKKIMSKKAQRVIVMADNSKLRRTSVYSVCGLNEVEALITDSGAKTEDIKKIAAAGCKVEIAPVEKS